MKNIEGDMEVDGDKRELKLLEYRAKVMPDLMKTNPGQWALIGFASEDPGVLCIDSDFGKVREEAKRLKITIPFVTYIPSPKSSGDAWM